MCLENVGRVCARCVESMCRVWVEVERSVCESVWSVEGVCRQNTRQIKAIARNSPEGTVGENKMTISFLMTRKQGYLCILW